MVQQKIFKVCFVLHYKTMGLLAVPKFLKEKYAHLYHTEHLSLFAHTRVFIDIASYLFKYVCTMGVNNSRWMNSFAYLMLTFRKNGVIGVPVFDGQAPEAKADEQRERRELRAKTKGRADLLEEALDAFDNNQMTPEMSKLLEKELGSNREASSSLLHPVSSQDGFQPQQIEQLRAALLSMRKQSTSLSKQDMQDLKTMLTGCGITWLQAPEEAEAYCSWLVRQGYGSAVVSCDTDCIAHRADIVIFNVDSHSGSIRYVNTAELLEAWELDDEDQLIDFGILVGCDYNPGSRVNKIGPVNAIKLLRQHGNIDNIPNLVDVSVLQHVKIRELFNPRYEEPLLTAGEVQRDLLEELMDRRRDIDKRALDQLVHYNTMVRLVKFSDSG